MEQKGFIAFVKANYVWLIALFVIACTFIGLCGSVVTSKGVAVAYVEDWEWYEVTKISSRADVTFSQIVSQGAYKPFIALYSIVIVSLVLTVLGKFVNKNLYIASTLILLCTGIFFLTANIFYDLALCKSLANEPNLLEDLHAVSETKLSFGTTFAGILCFAAALLNFSLASDGNQLSVSDMSEIGIFSAAAIGLQFIKVPIGATGGSINLGLVPLYIVALRHGPTKGFIASALVFGLITCLTDGYGFNTYPFDYLIGFGGCAVLGFFRKMCFSNNEKGWSPYGFIFVALGVILGTVIRFVGSSASSVINYGLTISAAMKYNLIYVFVTGAVSLVAMEILYIPLATVSKRFPPKSEK